jgi:hypothetical protein
MVLTRELRDAVQEGDTAAIQESRWSRFSTGTRDPDTKDEFKFVDMTYGTLTICFY